MQRGWQRLLMNCCSSQTHSHPPWYQQSTEELQARRFGLVHRARELGRRVRRSRWALPQRSRARNWHRYVFRLLTIALSLDHSPNCEHTTEVTIFTRVGIRRIATYAFQLAQSRPRKLLTYVTKSNAMRNGMVLWDEVVNEVAQQFPDVVGCLCFAYLAEIPAEHELPS
jgi:hypothetical protein